MQQLIDALPTAATSPLALVAYIVVAGVWLTYAYLRFKPLRKAESILQRFDEDKPRIDALRELTGDAPPAGLKRSEIMQWVRSQSQSRLYVLLLVAYISTLVAFLAVFAIAFATESVTAVSDTDVTGDLVVNGSAALHGTVALLGVLPRPGPYEISPQQPGYFEFRDLTSIGSTLHFDVSLPDIDYRASHKVAFTPNKAILIEVAIDHVIETGPELEATDDSKRTSPLESVKSGHAIVYDGNVHYGHGGYSFAKGALVAWDSGEADILVENTTSGSGLAHFFLQYDVGEAPLSGAPFDRLAKAGIAKLSAVSLEEVAECPMSGYESFRIPSEIGSVYCVRSRDGSHFAVIKVVDIQSDRIAFDWMYQTELSRRFRGQGP